MFRIAAIMAGEFVQKFVNCQTHIAVFAFGYIGAVFAFQIWSVAAPVLKKNDLLFVLQRFFGFFLQQGSEMTFHLLFAVGFFGIGNQNIRKFHFPETLIDSYIAIFTCFSVEITLDGWRSTTKQGFGTMK